MSKKYSFSAKEFWEFMLVICILGIPALFAFLFILDWGDGLVMLWVVCLLTIYHIWRVER